MDKAKLAAIKGRDFYQQFLRERNVPNLIASINGVAQEIGFTPEELNELNNYLTNRLQLIEAIQNVYNEIRIALMEERGEGVALQIEGFIHEVEYLLEFEEVFYPEDHAKIDLVYKEVLAIREKGQNPYSDFRRLLQKLVYNHLAFLNRIGLMPRDWKYQNAIRSGFIREGDILFNAIKIDEVIELQNRILSIGRDELAIANMIQRLEDIVPIIQPYLRAVEKNDVIAADVAKKLLANISKLKQEFGETYYEKTLQSCLFSYCEGEELENIKPQIKVIEAKAAPRVIVNCGHYSYFEGASQQVRNMLTEDLMEHYLKRLNPKKISKEELEKFISFFIEHRKEFTVFINEMHASTDVREVYDRYQGTIPRQILDFLSKLGVQYMDALDIIVEIEKHRNITNEEIAQDMRERGIEVDGEKLAAAVRFFRMKGIPRDVVLRTRRSIKAPWNPKREPPHSSIMSFIIGAYIARKYNGKMALYVEDYPISDKRKFQEQFFTNNFPDQYKDILLRFGLDPEKTLTVYFESLLKANLYNFLFHEGNLLEGQPERDDELGKPVSQTKLAEVTIVMPRKSKSRRHEIQFMGNPIAQYNKKGKETVPPYDQFRPECSLIVGELHYEISQITTDVITILPIYEIMCSGVMHYRPGISFDPEKINVFMLAYSDKQLQVELHSHKDMACSMYR